MEGFRKLHPALNSSEIRAGARHFYDGQVFYIGFHDLGAVGFERLDFQVEGVGNIHEDMRLEILSRGSLVK